ncbi:uncharacterized protein BO88DRAFT_457989 [Aspergillus vadensis CBS 113365]|uniref:Uncharacterized protein n=1 Tax=Aspergillus vadensis (strain CBS 113365 / IMI 142717 / IBT 24658) TaxID=1448311 RepID=A0A319AVQ1_ASPVC|nr:hypothetical protein BO88DRAFT_457989 [Aspergillus vadensis CBS 113365]PYH64456.1 hypothetical protein BO88DRAFT_457989 [Aspergillus vadensis CBS 113365]
MGNSFWKFTTDDGQTIAEATIQSMTAYADRKARLELSKKTSVESWKAICETEVQRLLYYRGRKQLSACSTDLAHVGGQTHHCSTIHVSFYFFSLVTRLSTIEFVIVLQIRETDLSSFG